MKEKLFEYDVIVVGASVAGAVSAYLLGRAGRKVLLVDPQVFPRQKACGEGLSVLGRDYLKAIGLWSSALERAAYPFYGYSIECQDGRRIELATGIESHKPQGYGISRLLLDTYIQNSATSLANVEVLAERVRKIDGRAGSWAVESSKGRRIHCSELVLAVGGAASSLIKTTSTRKEANPRYGMAFWCDGEWNKELPRTVKIFNRPEGQYIITPVSCTKINFSILLDRNFLPALSKAEVRSRALKIVERAGFSIESFSEIRGASAIHSSRSLRQRQDYYLVGDALERIDPVGGMGMTHAIYSSMLAANSILQYEISSAQRTSRYYSKQEKGARILRLMTGLSAGLNISNNRLLVALTAWSPGMSLKCMSYLRAVFPEPELGRLVDIVGLDTQEQSQLFENPESQMLCRNREVLI